MSSMLLTERNTPTTERLVRKAAAAKFGRQARPYFEHGQWWLIVTNYYEPGDDAIFSVVDADPGVQDTGLDFEEC